jgi:hypothetical protein
MNPIDYTLHVATPFQSALQGYQAGAAIRNDGLQAQAQQVELQQQQAKLQAAQQQQALLNQLAANPNAGADDYTRVMTQIPALAENLSKVWKIKDASQQQTHSTNLLQWGAAIKSGQPQIAVQQMRDRADAMEAAGQDQEAAAVRANAGVLEQNPALALGMIQAQLAASPLGKDAAEALAKFGAELEVLHGLGLCELRSHDRRLCFRSGFCAATSREGNDLKREELRLKLDEAVQKRDDKLREKVSTAEAGATNIDNMLNTIQRIQQNPRLNSVIGSIEGRLPDMGSDQSADAIALIETLGSQAFLAQIPNIKGMGALSNAEGEKLQSALQNLSRKQSETQFRANLNEASRLLMKGRENISKSTGVDIGKPDTPAAPGARPPLSSFQR